MPEGSGICSTAGSRRRAIRWRAGGIAATPSLSRVSAVVATPSSGTAFDVGGEPEHGLGGRVGPAGDQPGRDLYAVGRVIVPYLARDCGRARRERGAAAPAGSGERGIGGGETPRSPRRAPRQCGRASRTRRNRTGPAVPPGSALGVRCRPPAATGPRCRRSARSWSGGTSASAAGLKARSCGCVAGLLPVAQEDDRGTGDVVGVVGALGPVAGGGVEVLRRRPGIASRPPSCPRRSTAAWAEGSRSQLVRWCGPSAGESGTVSHQFQMVKVGQGWLGGA